jgi:putative ABC transport system permease protein
MHAVVFDLALRSALNRKATVLLTVLAIAIGVASFVTVEKLREGARSGFERTISGTDLIVGARTGSINLLLFTVFHIGEVPANITWESYQEVANWPEVDWAIPISLGDSYRGYRVVGTDRAFLEHYRYGDGRRIRLQAGEWFAGRFDTVLGAEVAAALGLTLGDDVTLSHGLRSTAFTEHDNAPFAVSGILARTGTPVDRSVFVGLDGIEAMHFGWQGGVRTPLARMARREQLEQMTLQPKSLSAAFLGLESPIAVLQVQRNINTLPEEALMAVLPGVTLARLWEVVGTTEQVMLLMTALIVVVGLVSILVSLLSTLGERRREIAVLRAVGARPLEVFALLIGEAAMMALAGGILGVALVQVAAASVTPLIETRFGLTLTHSAPGLLDLGAVGVVTLIGAVLGCIPGWLAYRRALAEGLTVRI